MDKHNTLLDPICTEDRGVAPETLLRIITLAIEIAREGREGRQVGTLFVVGDSEETLKRSKCLILDPLYSHSEDRKKTSDHNIRETIKELAQLDGAFIISNEGVALSAARYINTNSEGIEMPLGLGSRHLAAASISKETQAVSVVVSESSIVRVFDDGEMIAEIIPEAWKVSQYTSHLKEPFDTYTEDQITVFIKKG